MGFNRYSCTGGCANSECNDGNEASQIWMSMIQIDVEPRGLIELW